MASKIGVVLALLVVLVLVVATVGIVSQIAPTPTSVKAYERVPPSFDDSVTLHARHQEFTPTTTAAPPTGASVVLTGAGSYVLEWYEDCDVPGIGWRTRANGAGSVSLTSTPTWYTILGTGNTVVAGWDCELRWIERSPGTLTARLHCAKGYGCAFGTDALVAWGEPVPPEEPEPDPNDTPADGATNYTGTPSTTSNVPTEPTGGGPPPPPGPADVGKIAVVVGLAVLALVLVAVLVLRTRRRP